MLRVVTLTAVLLIAADAVAQQRPLIRNREPQPAGIIAPPVVATVPGTLLQSPPQDIRPRGILPTANWGLWNYGGCYSYFPDYDIGRTSARPTIVINNNYSAPAGEPEPAPAPNPRAHLKLHVPNGANVWLAGKAVDTAVTPLVLNSPVLKPGQSYTFDVRVTWQELGKREERTRQVTVPAGESKSLTYFAGR